jgi:hypothetical protein
VYVPLAVLLTVAGLQVPVIPLVEIVGNNGATVPLQKGAIAAKVGVVLANTATLVVVLLQVVAVLVKVKVTLPVATPVTTPAFVTVAIAVLLLVQVPLVVGLSVMVLPTHTFAGAVTVGLGFTVTVTFFVSGQLNAPTDPEVTVYVIVLAGVAVTVAPVVALKLVFGLHEYTPLPPLAVNATPALPAHIVGVAGVTFNTFTPAVAVMLKSQTSPPYPSIIK